MTVTIYTKPAGCFGCTKTKQKFTDAGIAFTEVDVTTNPAAFEYITEELGYSRSPSWSTTRTTPKTTGPA
jgi:glutaredoxin-like protein NrdH